MSPIISIEIIVNKYKELKMTLIHLTHSDLVRQLAHDFSQAEETIEDIIQHHAKAT